MESAPMPASSTGSSTLFSKSQHGQSGQLQAADGALTVCSFCKRILLPLALVPKEQLPTLLKSIEANNKTPLPIPTEPSPDSPHPIPVLGLRGKRGHHVFTQQTKAAWLTAFQYYVLAKQADRADMIVRHGVCGGCWEEMCAVVGVPGWLEKGKRLWGGE
jgi:hypothetical protein